jgi:hypothetical protein
MKIKTFICVLLWSLVLSISIGFSASLSRDGFYWTVDGQKKLLLGSSSEDNLFQTPKAELLAELDRLQQSGGNYVRNVMSFRDEGNLLPYERRGDYFDLNTWNDDFWQRLDFFFQETQRRNIIVQLEIWATFDYYRDNWLNLNPFNPKNNINYGLESGLPEVVASHPAHHENPFFYSVPTQKDLTIIRNYQEQFVEKILSYSLKYDHILYCIDNETAVSPDWGQYWSELITRSAKAINKTVYITEMWDAHNIKNQQHSFTYNYPESYQFVEVSQNNHSYGRDVYENLKWIRSKISAYPRPMNAVKVYGNKKYGTATDAINRFWTNIFAGTAAIRFHRPESGLGGTDLSLDHIRSARALAHDFSFVNALPAQKIFKASTLSNIYILESSTGDVAALFPANYSKIGTMDKVLNFVFNKKRRLAIDEDLSHRWSRVWWFLPEQNLKLDPITLSKGKSIIKPPDDRCWIAIFEAR